MFGSLLRYVTFGDASSCHDNLNSLIYEMVAIVISKTKQLIL